jgi:hypothetical protein
LGASVPSELCCKEIVMHHRHPAMGASPAPSLRPAPGTGLSAPIFWLRYSLRQKYFRFYPLRCPKIASMLFLDFGFSLRKNPASITAGIPAGGLPLGVFAARKLQAITTQSIHAIFALYVFASRAAFTSIRRPRQREQTPLFPPVSPAGLEQTGPL